MTDFANEMIRASHGEADVDDEEVVVDGVDNHGVPRPDEAGGAQGRLLHRAHLVDGPVVVQQVGHR